MDIHDRYSHAHTHVHTGSERALLVASCFNQETLMNPNELVISSLN